MFWKFLPRAASLAVMVVYVLGEIGNIGPDRGPHPSFWNKLPEPGHNNVWYDNHNPTTVFVFVHGIFSDSRGCWLCENNKEPMKAQYWPELVTTDKRFEQPAIFLRLVVHQGRFLADAQHHPDESPAPRHSARSTDLAEVARAQRVRHDPGVMRGLLASRSKFRVKNVAQFTLLTHAMQMQKIRPAL